MFCFITLIEVQLHKAIDEHFPTTSTTSDQFKKTVFSEESTETGKMPAAHPQSELEAQLAAQAKAGNNSPSAPPRAVDRRSPGEKSKDKAADFFEGESVSRKPFEHPIESKADVVSVFIMIAVVLSILGVLGFCYILLFQ